MSSKPKVTELTEAQKARMPEFVERWTKIGLDQSPIEDRAPVRSSLLEAYACGGQSEPVGGFLFFPGPETMLYAAYCLCRIEKSGSGRLEEFLAAGTEQETEAKLQELIDGLSLDERKEAIRTNIDNCCYGHHEAAWLSFYSYMREVVGLVEETEKVTGLMKVAEVSGWFYPCEKVCLVSEKPLLKLDEQNRLHNPAGPALYFRNGKDHAFYAWHGVRIPSEWITNPESVDPSLALTWDNIEQRRCLAEILGWDKVLAQLKVEVLQEDEYGQLIQADIPDSRGQKFVKVLCGTGRTFVIPVPREMKTCLEAVAWTYNVQPEEYAQLQGRT